MSPSLENLLIGIVTSIITGSAVWFWEKTRRARNLNLKSRFFGLAPSERCLIVMNHFPGKQGTMSHGDIYTLIEVAKIIYEIKGEIILAPFDKTLEAAGSITEFCIGGPESNKRTKAHLANFLKGIQTNPYTHETEPLAILTKEKKYIYNRKERHYAILAKIWPSTNAHPVFLICGQTSTSNNAAIHYLLENYNNFLRKKFSSGRFCLIVEITSPESYGHKMVKLVDDVTDFAFEE